MGIFGGFSKFFIFILLRYKRNAKQAVDSLTFGVKKSECFGLLGKFKPETNKIFSKQFASVPQIRFENFQELMEPEKLQHSKC